MPSQSHHQAPTPSPQGAPPTMAQGKERGSRGNAAAQEQVARQQQPTRGPLPYRAELEAAFGEDLGDLEVLFGGGGGGQGRSAPPSEPDLGAGDGPSLPANAATDGRVLWFRDPEPSLEQVAHEVAHVVQSRQGSADGEASEQGDLSEQEAEQVGRDVAAGKQADVQQRGRSSLYGDWIDGLADAFDLRDNEDALDLQEDIADFKSQDYGPITYTRPNISGSGFDASYFPNSEQFRAEVRGKVRFADGLVDNGGTLSSPNHFMNQGQLITILNTFPDLKAQVLPYYQWGADEREICRLRFQQNIQATTALWQDTGLSFQVDEPGWEAVVARPDIRINVTEGEATTATEDYGPFGIFTRTDQQGSDHLQIEIVKQISTADATTVNGLITAYLAANAPGMAAPPAGNARGVRSYLGNDPGSRNGNPAGVNNFMSLESNRSDDSNGRTYDHTVSFANNEDTLSSGEQSRLDQFLADPMVLLQNPSGAVNVSLHGYASAPGSTAANTALVDRRLGSVSNVINAKMASSNLNIQTAVDPAAQQNDADRSAEADPTGDPARYRRVDIHIEQTGRGGQNVLAHEFGHVFGLGDEYAEVGNGYNRPAGSAADHDGLARNAGVAQGATVGNDQRMMSTGNQVGAAHYSTFADALRQLTGKGWKIV